MNFLLLNHYKKTKRNYQYELGLTFDNPVKSKFLIGEIKTLDSKIKEIEERILKDASEAMNELDNAKRKEVIRFFLPAIIGLIAITIGALIL